MGGLILGVNTLYKVFCLFKLTPNVRAVAQLVSALRHVILAMFNGLLKPNQEYHHIVITQSSTLLRQCLVQDARTVF